MEKLAELIISLLNLAEAEGRLLQEGALRTTRRCIIMVIAMSFGAASLAFFIGALYVFLIIYLPLYIVLAILAGICGLICLGLLWSTRRVLPKAPKS